MLLIFTHKITPRFSYTMKQVFTRILGIEVEFATKVEDFIKHSGPKITYSKQPLQNEFFIRSHDLLFEQGINDMQIAIEKWDNTPCFFAAGERSNIPFDIFAASFYLISRYEEYLPHVKDQHGRYPVSESLAFRNNFLELPVVDIWAYKLLVSLKNTFPEIQTRSKSYKYQSIIDVTTSHCYAHRGIVRNVGGLFLDLVKLKLRNVFKRISVWFNPTKDPYDNFDYLIQLHKKFNVKSIFFFQFAEYSHFDKNISPNNNRFRYLIKAVADYSRVSISASYNSFGNQTLLKEEKRKLGTVIHRPIKNVRFRYNRIEVPFTYRDLVDADFRDDYTLGYTNNIGFRAGTCTSFYFYDIHLEHQQPIRIHPFVVHDYAFLNDNNVNDVMNEIISIYNSIKAVNGEMITVFSNELLGGKHKMDWLKMYKTTIQKCNV